MSTETSKRTFDVKWSRAICSIALISCCVWPSIIRAQVQPEWTRQLGTTSSEQGWSVFADPSGIVYLAGYSGGALASANVGEHDAFVSKLDGLGNVLWTKQFGTSASEQVLGVASDASGNVCVAGFTAGALAGPNQGLNDGFIRKYDSSGNVAWTRQFGGLYTDFARAVSADSAGNIYVTGEMYGGSQATTANAFLRKYDSAGNLQWSKNLSSSAWEAGFGVAADSLGNVYMSGSTGGNLGGTLFGNNDAFVSKYDLNGNLLWIRQLGTAANDGSQSIAADGFGSIYISGGTSAALGNSHAGNTDSFVSKYDGAGNLIWTQQIGTAMFDSSWGVSTDVSGDVYISGETQGSLLAGSPGGTDAFVIKYSNSGNHLWTEQFGTSVRDSGRAVSVNIFGDVFISGFTEGNLGSPNAGGFDAFVAKYGEVPEPSTVILLMLGFGMQVKRAIAMSTKRFPSKRRT